MCSRTKKWIAFGIASLIYGSCVLIVGTNADFSNTDRLYRTIALIAGTMLLAALIIGLSLGPKSIGFFYLILVCFLVAVFINFPK